MKSTAPAEHGYSPGMAVRHLLTGPFRPRAAMREGLATGLGEWSRLGLFAVAAALYGLTDPEVRASFETYVETVRQSPGPYEWILGSLLLVAVLGLLVVVFYVSQSVILYALFRLGTRSKPTFVTTRSVLALSDWITVGLGSALLLALRGLLPSQGIGAQSDEFTIMMVMISPYLVLLIAEATGSSLFRSAVLLLLALTGDAIILSGIDAGLERLNAFLRSISPEYKLA